jgi:hypothetical protein
MRHGVVVCLVWCATVSATLAAAVAFAAQAPAPSAAPIGPTIAAELRAFCDATTLHAWRSLHPNEEIRAYEGDWAGAGFNAVGSGPAAVTASARLTVAGVRKLRRTVYFYAPPAAGRPLPAEDASAESLRDQALAGYLWIEIVPVIPKMPPC